MSTSCLSANHILRLKNNLRLKNVHFYRETPKTFCKDMNLREAAALFSFWSSIQSKSITIAVFTLLLSFYFTQLNILDIRHPEEFL